MIYLMLRANIQQLLEISLIVEIKIVFLKKMNFSISFIKINEHLIPVNNDIFKTIFRNCILWNHIP